MFAHVSQLGDLLRGVNDLLDEDGVFVTESHYLLDLLDKVQYDSIYHEHLRFYSLRSLGTLFKQYGFSVVDAERIPNYGGSIRVYAKKGVNLVSSENLSNLMAAEEHFGLYSAETFSRFKEKTQKAALDLQYTVVSLRKAGHTVAAIGCPGRASTLVNYSNLSRELVSYIAEQATSLKLGMYLPGKHIPIVDEEILFREPPDYVVMLSWHYAEPIIASLKKKGMRSKVIIPLPDVRILE